MFALVDFLPNWYDLQGDKPLGKTKEDICTNRHTKQKTHISPHFTDLNLIGHQHPVASHRNLALSSALETLICPLSIDAGCCTLQHDYFGCF
jgi:hypothetical protein